MRIHPLFAFTVVFFLSFSVLAETPEETLEGAHTDEEASTLTGTWGGFRPRLSERGLDLELTYAGHLASNLQPTAGQNYSFFGLATAGLEWNLTPLTGFSNTTVALSFIATHGTPISAMVGDEQGTNNIESDPMAQLYEAWLQKGFFEDLLSFRVGVLDANLEFYALSSTDVFLNSSFGIGREASQSPLNSAVAFAVYPATSLGARAKVASSKGYYAQLGVYDAIPAIPTATQRRPFFSTNDSYMWIGELGFGAEQADGNHKVAMGAWAHTANVNAITVEDGGSHMGVYAIAEAPLVRRLSGFVRAGYANPQLNAVTSCLTAGLVFDTPFGLGNNDQIGLGVATIFGSSSYLATLEDPAAYETAIELTYKVEPVKGITIQPDFQYVVNPGLTSSPDAWVLSSRFEVAL